MEKVENGFWRCKSALLENKEDPNNDRKVCISKELKCADDLEKELECDLICLENTTHTGWYYQVIILFTLTVYQ